jgi:hypothetical protein
MAGRARKELAMKFNWRLKSGGRCLLPIFGMLILFSAVAPAQSWTWTSEMVDPDGGTFNSLAIDTDGNAHIGYLSPEGGGTKYGFRSVSGGRWFTMVVDKNNGFVSLALDSHQRPHLCYTPYGILKYASFENSKWQIQEVAPHSGSREFSCGVAIGPDDVPHVTWYQYSDTANQLYLHIRHAELKQGTWQAHTLDFSRETGKWNSVRVDAQGRTYVSYSAFRDGAMRTAVSGPDDKWAVATVEDGRTGRKQATTPGMGNSMVLDSNGKTHFAYRDETSLRYAWPEGDHWRIDVVDPNANPFENLDWINQRTSLALDANGRPHIAYETDGALKHAWWDGEKWKIQAMGIAGTQHRNPSLAISRDNVIFIGYTNPEDGSLKVLIGRPNAVPAANLQTNNGVTK